MMSRFGAGLAVTPAAAATAPPAASIISRRVMLFIVLLSPGLERSPDLDLIVVDSFGGDTLRRQDLDRLLQHDRRTRDVGIGIRGALKLTIHHGIDVTGLAFPFILRS